VKVWIDQDLCTGDGLCEELCPSMFVMRDGISFVREVGAQPRLVGGSTDVVPVPVDLLDAVLDAAEECPGECIFVEP
jgi:ferredoxin